MKDKLEIIFKFCFKGFEEDAVNYVTQTMWNNIRLNMFIHIFRFIYLCKKVKTESKNAE